jgi:hypothetical protein
MAWLGNPIEFIDTLHHTRAPQIKRMAKTMERIAMTPAAAAKIPLTPFSACTTAVDWWDTGAETSGLASRRRAIRSSCNSRYSGKSLQKAGSRTLKSRDCRAIFSFWDVLVSTLPNVGAVSIMNE